MIHSCESSDIAAILTVVNDASEAYRGVVPADCWKEPYMAEEELRREIAAGVEFYGWEEDETVLAVMGLQHAGTAALIRHAYTRTAEQGRGLGGRLLAHLRGLARAPLLVGTWADPRQLGDREQHADEVRRLTGDTAGGRRRSSLAP